MFEIEISGSTCTVHVHINKHNININIHIVHNNNTFPVVQSPYRAGQVDTGSCPDEIVHHISVAIATGIV